MNKLVHMIYMAVTYKSCNLKQAAAFDLEDYMELCTQIPYLITSIRLCCSLVPSGWSYTCWDKAIQVYSHTILNL